MKIVLIGTINKDLILPHEGEAIQSIGGIYYSVSALSNICNEETEIIPIAYLGNDLYDDFINLLRQYSNVSSSGLDYIDQRNHEVILEYSSAEHRSERAFFNFPSLDWEKLKLFLDADFFIVNLITGWDISLDAFLKLSQEQFSKIFLDVHFLVMGIDKLGRRIPQRPENIEKWLAGARFVQMNQREYEIIANEPMNEVAFFEKFFHSDQILIITRGSEGAYLIFRKEGIVRKKFFPAYRFETTVDVTGCGDVFGAGFVWRYLMDRDIYKAMEYATLAAGANSLLKGTTEMDKLVSLMEKVTTLENGQ